MPSRRAFLKNASLVGAASVTWASGLSANTPLRLDTPQVSPKDLARDEEFWSRVAAQYQVPGGVINLEAGYFGLMAAPVLEAFHRNVDRANNGSSFFARRDFPALYQATRQKVAAFVGAKPTEVAISRNASEALQALIGQYNKVGPGDAVMYADLDYNAMQWAMNELAARRGATVARLNIPEPASHDGIIQAYRTALDANPKTKLLLLTSCNNCEGDRLACPSARHRRGGGRGALVWAGAADDG
jgi:kynureninase